MSANYRRTTGSINVMNRWAQDSRAARKPVAPVESADDRAARMAELKARVAASDKAAGRKVWSGAK